MRSSISNFKPGHSRRRLGSALGAFAVTFALALLAGFFLPTGPDRAWRGENLGIPSDVDYVINETDSDHFDIYDCLYYGIGGAVERARKADVLLLGNSRVLFAFRSAKVEESLAETGVKLFNLCFPANDGMVMAWETLLRHDLRPAVVVVNANDFFTMARSPYGKDTVEEGAWRARLRLWEHRTSWSARLLFHRLFPRFNIGQIYGAAPNVSCQALSNGCLVFENFSRKREAAPIQEKGSTGDFSPEELKLAGWFKAEMEKRGTKLILISIPYDMESYIRARRGATSREALALTPENLKPFRKADKLARALGVPLVMPDVAGLRTMDGSHLTEESANRFAGDFFKKFLKLYQPKWAPTKSEKP
jgi:hypothetical protein